MLHFVGIYLALWASFTLVFTFVGEDSYRGFWFNLGKAMWWPLAWLHRYPRIDASSHQDFAFSYRKVEVSGCPEQHDRFQAVVGLISFYQYALQRHHLRQNDYDAMLEQGKGAAEFITELAHDEQLQMSVARYMAGMTFGDVLKHQPAIEHKLHMLFYCRSHAAPLMGLLSA